MDGDARIMTALWIVAVIFAFIGGFFLGSAGLLSERLRTWRILTDAIGLVEYTAPYSGDGRLPIPMMLDSLNQARTSLRLTDRQLRHEQLPPDFTDDDGR